MISVMRSLLEIPWPLENLNLSQKIYAGIQELNMNDLKPHDNHLLALM